MRYGYFDNANRKYGITRFRPNGVPMDGPGHYVYLRDKKPEGRSANEYQNP